MAAAPVIVLVALIALFALRSLHRDPQVVPMAMIGRPAPPLDLPALRGSGERAVRGPVLLNVFASWCEPCAREAPALMALHVEGIRIIGVAYKDAPAATDAFLQRYGDPYEAVLLDSRGAAGIALGVTGAPETLAVDSHGVIRGKRIGPLDAEGAEALIAQARRG